MKIYFITKYMDIYLNIDLPFIRGPRKQHIQPRKPWEMATKGLAPAAHGGAHGFFFSTANKLL
jgi:hypothetical protein